MSYITAIGVANPEFRFEQSEIAEFMVRAMKLDDTDARKLKALYHATGIQSRYSVIADYGRKSDFQFYHQLNSDDVNLAFPGTRERLELFRRHAVQLSVQSARQIFKKIPALKPANISHLVVVSCTGMYAPGLDIDLVRELKLRPDVQRTCINFMGCYAAFNGLKLADSFCAADTEAHVLVVCTELCSIHFQKENTEDNILANALFGDGSAALLIESQPRSGLNLKPESFYCEIASEGSEAMAWTVGDVGFEMKLSSYVPEIIRNGIKNLTEKLLSNIKQPLSSVHYFAIHPGGRKILEVIESELGMSREQNAPAYETLREYGNMSSPTVLFVLNRLCQKLNGVDNGKKILSFAFGPGLTMESMVLSVVNA